MPSRPATCSVDSPARRTRRLPAAVGSARSRCHCPLLRRHALPQDLTAAGQHANCPRFIPLMESIRILRRGLGRPRRRPGRALADKAYSSAANRAYLRRRGIQAVIPVKEDQKAHRRNRGSAGGRSPIFDAGRYKERSTMERCVNRLKAFRAVVTRYDKRERIYRAPSTLSRSGSDSVTRFHDQRRAGRQVRCGVAGRWGDSGCRSSFPGSSQTRWCGAAVTSVGAGWRMSLRSRSGCAASGRSS